MKRVVAIVLALSFLSVTSSFAQARPDFSAKAAGITTADTTKAVVARAPAPQAAPAKKSFWKTPWPYVIAAVVVVGVVVATNKDGSSY